MSAEQFWSEGLDLARCPDLTKAPRGWLQCLLVAGHEQDPRSFHHVDPSGAVVDVAAAWEQGHTAGWDDATDVTYDLTGKTKTPNPYKQETTND